MIDSDEEGPVDLGNPDEHGVLKVAELVLKLTGSWLGDGAPSPPTDDPPAGAR